MITLRRKHLYLLSILSGVLLSAGWPARGFPFLLLIAFCPILVVEHFLFTNKAKKTTFSFLGYAYVAMLVWNTLTTWWVCNSTIVGGIAAIVCNSFFMAVVLMLFHSTKRRAGVAAGYASLPILWLAFEYVHLNWQLSWPWLTLGFGFSNYVHFMQWYEYTGPLGGSLWILLCNIVIFQLINSAFIIKNKSQAFKRMRLAAILVILPIILSLTLYANLNSHSLEKGKPMEVVVIQPNIDPYNEKFSGDYENQLQKMLTLADTKVDSTTAYLIFPETALTDTEIWENDFQNNTSIVMLWKYLHKHPNLSLLTGAGTFRGYKKGDVIPESARKYTSEDGYYDAYNTALQLDSSKNIQVYHKCKLVPGVEFMPFSKLLAPLGKLAFDLGGTSGTLGTQKEPSVFYSSYSKTTIAPAICYESIYGEYIGEYIKKGAEMIFVITNDGWWQDTPGYRQHLCYGAMLAAETRKQLVQCANTGISAIINERGEILQRTNWWVPAVIKATLYPSETVTFYARYGDYPGLYASYLSILLIGYLLTNKIMRYFRPKISS